MGRHALLVGVRQFDDPRIHPLNAPDRDVRELDQVLRDPRICRFDSVELCLNEPYDSIRKKIVDLTARRAPDDLVLLYYSGHGVLEFDSGLYFMTRDSNLDRLQAASFHSDEIRSFLNRSRSRRQILVLDCCHAGAYGGAGFKDAGAPRPAVTQNTFDPHGYGRVVIMASSEVQVVPDGAADGLSPFTGFLVEGLRDGLAAPDDENISVQAWASYAETRMRRLVPGVTPRILEDQQAGPILIARNPSAGAARIPAELADALGDADPLRRGGAIARLAALLHGEDAALGRAVRRLLEARQGQERDADLRDMLRASLGAAKPAEPAPARAEKARRMRAAEPERAEDPEATIDKLRLRLKEAFEVLAAEHERARKADAARAEVEALLAHERVRSSRFEAELQAARIRAGLEPPAEPDSSTVARTPGFPWLSRRR